MRLHQLLNAAIRGVPEVDRVAEGHAEHIRRGPVEQIEVEVIQQLGRVQELSTENMQEALALWKARFQEGDMHPETKDQVSKLDAVVLILPYRVR